MICIDCIANPLWLIRTRYALSYLLMNLLFYGVIALGMLIVTVRPEIQRTLTSSIQHDFRTPAWAPLLNAYLGGHLIRAAVLTFAVNFVLGTAMELSFPSLFIPFFGILFGIFRALLWGLIFGPAEHGNFFLLKTHGVVMILEGQGYVLAMLSVYIHGKAIIKPNSVGAAGTWQGYKRGFVESMRIYPLIALVLAASALYEAWEVIYLAHR